MQHFFIILQHVLFFVLPTMACMVNEYGLKFFFVLSSIFYVTYYIIIVLLGVGKVNKGILNVKIGREKYNSLYDIPSLCNPVRLWYSDEYMESTFSTCFKGRNGTPNETKKSNAFKKFFGY